MTVILAAPPAERLTVHFTLRECCVTLSGLDNVPPPWAVVNLRAVCVHVAEPIRTLLDRALVVDSGYRSPDVNKAAGGNRHSPHLEGEALDLVPVGMKVGQAMAWIAREVRAGRIPADQVIVYPSRGFIHVSYTSSSPNRGELLTSPSKGIYDPYQE